MPAKHLPYPYVEPDAASQSLLEIEVLADRCATEWGYKDGKTLEEVCKSIEVDIEYSHDPNEIMLEVPPDSRAVIWLPRKGRKRDDRVVVATALGHWAMHVESTRAANPGCGVQALYQPTSNEARQEASTFGMAFLMPSNEFVETWSEGRSQAASDRFDVPTQITYLRARDLDIRDPV